MKSTNTAPSTRPAAKITTEVLVEMFGARAHTPRASYCRVGHWQGLVPIKMPNGRLMWDLDEANRLLAGETVKTPDAAQIDAHATRKAAAKIPAHIARKIEAKAKRLTGEQKRAAQLSEIDASIDGVRFELAELDTLTASAPREVGK